MHFLGVLNWLQESSGSLTCTVSLNTPSKFRIGQWNGISKILNGEDVIVVIPTGGGKTVMYALPCIMKPGLAVVTSPLMMLMCDQVARLRGYGIITCWSHCKLLCLFPE